MTAVQLIDDLLQDLELQGMMVRQQMRLKDIQKLEEQLKDAESKRGLVAAAAEVSVDMAPTARFMALPRNEMAVAMTADGDKESVNTKICASEKQMRERLAALELEDENDTESAIEQILTYDVRKLAESAETFANKEDTDKDWHLVIFLHGFNNDTENINERDWYIDDALGTKRVLTTCFHWEGKADQDGMWGVVGKLRYKGDRKTVDALAPHFNSYIAKIRACPIFKDVQIDIIAHSMGCQLLCNAIKHEKCKPELFKKCSIVCMAADVKKEDYVKCAEKVKLTIQESECSWSHFWYEADHALQASNWFNWTNFGDRAGQQEMDEPLINKSHDPFIKSFQCEAAEDDMVNHSYIDEIMNKKKNKVGHFADLRNDVLAQLKLS